jgi:hypothetical protein
MIALSFCREISSHVQTAVLFEAVGATLGGVTANEVKYRL